MRLCSDAGNWLFCGRRWINPADPDGRAKLDLHYDNLSILFPAFTTSCSLDRLIDAVSAVINSWSRHNGSAAICSRRFSAVDISPSPPSPTDEPPEAHAAARLSGPVVAGPDHDWQDSDRGGWGPGPVAWPSPVTGVAALDDDLCQWSRAFAASAN
jgi:hypothetical protein